MKHLKRLRPTEEERILEAISNGLSILRSKQGLVWIDEEIKKRDRRGIEDKVSRALYRCLEQSQNNLKRLGQDLMGTLCWQMPIQPDPMYPMGNMKIRSQTSPGRFLTMQ